MKLIFTFFLVLTFTAFAQVEPVDTDGDGYRNISTLEQLRWVSENDSSWSWSFELDNDIDASDTRNWNIGDHDDNPETPDSAMGWLPIGTEDLSFTGDFNGNGFAIDGLYANQPESELVAFIKYTNSCTINNLSVTYCYIKGYEVSAIVALNRGIVINCYVKGVFFGVEAASGLVAVNRGIIDSCTVNATIYSPYCAGGISCSNIGIIKNTSFEGSIKSNELYCGGIVGFNHKSIINSNSQATINGNDCTGGIAGLNDGLISACQSYGKINGKNYVGGLSGFSAYAVQNSFSNCHVMGVSSVGGLVGCSSGKITDSYSCSRVYCDSISGGLVGENRGVVYDSYWNIDSSIVEYSDGGIDKTTNELQDRNTFQNWNFDYIWSMDSTYPYINLNYQFRPEDHDSNGYYDIYDISDFDWMSETGLNCNLKYELKNNIIGSKSKFKNDTLGYKPIDLFSGMLKFNNYSIDSLFINRPDENYIGLFGMIKNFEYIEFLSTTNDLSLKNFIITGKNYVGGIAGYVYNYSFSNCYLSGKITCNDKGGGIAGNYDSYMLQSIDSCKVNVNIKGNDYIGAIAGKFYETSLTNCIVSCEINGNDYLGGIAGISDDSEISNISIECNIIGNNYIGGLTGINERPYISNILKNCNVKCYLKGNEYIGGVTGKNHFKINTCKIEGAIEGNTKVGGITGYNEDIIDSSSFKGTVKGKYEVGGIAGRNRDEILNCYSNSTVTGDSVVGGLVGKNDIGEVTKCYSIGKVSGILFIGGLIGSIYYPNIYDPYYCGNINNSFSRSEVIGIDKIGGLSGNMQGYCNEVSNCYSTGTVNGDTNLGGFIGENFHLEFVENSFWDLETSQIDSSAGGTGKSTAEMKTKSTFTEAGWDFDTIWFISEDVNDGYPALFGMDNPVTSVSDEMIKDDDLIKISPNPASEYIEISLNKPSEGLKPSEDSEIEIYDVLGNKINYSTPSLLRNATPQEGNFKIDISNIPRGVYFIKIGNRTEKFVKK